MILLDSSTLIHYLKGRPSVVSQLEATPFDEVGIPSIVAYEIEYGTAKVTSAARRRAVTQLLNAFPEVPFDQAAALDSARIRLDLEARGVVIGPLDLLIAGTARSRGATLVTGNAREFSRVKGLRVENWSV